MQVYKILFHTQYAHAINLIDTISISFPSCSIRNTHSTIILPLKKITNNINLTFHNCNKVLNVITLLSSLQTYNYNITEYISSTSYAPTSTDKQDPHACIHLHTASNKRHCTQQTVHKSTSSHHLKAAVHTYHILLVSRLSYMRLFLVSFLPDMHHFEVTKWNQTWITTWTARETKCANNKTAVQIEITFIIITLATSSLY